MPTTTSDTINGSFGSLDFTSLPYFQGATASYDSSDSILTVTSGSNYETITLSNPGQTSFQATGDGRSGVNVAGAGGSTVTVASTPGGPPIQASSSDYVLQITFNNDQISAQSSHGLSTGALSGSVRLDYTTGSATSDLTFTSNGHLETYTNTNFIGNEPNNNTAVSATNSLNDNDEVYFDFNGQQPASLSSFILTSGAAGPSTGPYYTGDPSITSNVVCFRSGTLIRTARGDAAVENLSAGDLVVTASGAVRPIRWLGHRTLDLRNHPALAAVMPICIAAGAFGPSKPARDLFVSPSHAICVDTFGEVLIPAVALVNGSTIAPVEVDSVTYWHVELDSHDILLAENLPAESYLEMGNRSFFSQDHVVSFASAPDAPVPTHADFCRPFHAGGPLVDAVKAQLAKRAEAQGWSIVRGLDLHLEVDGRRFDPVIRNLTARFHIPADAKDVWLVSPTARPSDTMGTGDQRVLGVDVGALRIEDGLSAPRDVAINDPLLCVGFHEVENGARRWTAGRARLPAALWEGYENDFYLRVDLAGLPVPRWTAPVAEAASLEHPQLAFVA